MPELLVLSEDEVRRLLDLDGLAAALRTALRSVSAGTASVPARIGAYSEAGLLGAMPGFVPGLGLGAKLVAYLRDNHTRGLPGHQALITLFNPNDGTPCALMGGSGAEVDPETLAVAAVFVESRTSATRPFPAGARELSGMDPDTVTEVGEVLLGKHPGRTSDTEITVYKSTGHASEDLAAAAVVYRAALAGQVGTRVTATCSCSRPRKPGPSASGGPLAR